MSLTSQLSVKNSPVSEFFTKYEKEDGSKKCLALLQSTEPIRPMLFTPSSKVTYSFMGTTTDYLIRYTANSNTLQFETTIAQRALFSALLTRSHANVRQHLENLFEIGKQNLDGRDASDYQAIYSATALAVMDGFYRSGFLPGLFCKLIQKEEKYTINKHNGRNIKQKTTNYLFDQFYIKLGGDQYAQDISEMIRLFVKARNVPGYELYQAEMVVFNQTLGNSRLVGGADFDCIIKNKNCFVLTDIKTTIKPLKVAHLRQILSYALLYDEKKDNFKFTHVGIYYSRSGSFRSLPLDNIIEMTLPDFRSVTLARKAFITSITNAKLIRQP